MLEEILEILEMFINAMEATLLYVLLIVGVILIIVGAICLIMTKFLVGSLMVVGGIFLLNLVDNII